MLGVRVWGLEFGVCGELDGCSLMVAVWGRLRYSRVEGSCRRIIGVLPSGYLGRIFLQAPFYSSRGNTAKYSPEP